MRWHKIFPSVAAATIISVLMAVLPAVPAAAQSIALSPSEGQVGSTVTITGTGFTAGNSIRIEFRIDSTYSPRQWITLTTTSFSTTFTVPTTASVGSHLVRAYDEDAASVAATAYFTVIAPEIEITPDEGPVGTEVEIEGTNFDDSEDIIVEYDGDDIDIDSGDDDTDSDGEFTSYIIIPDSVAGDHTITVTGEDSDREAEAEFTVEPEISLSPASGAAGTEVTISGTGFDADEDIDITFGGTDLDIDIESDQNGSFSGTFTVPSEVRDTYDVEADDGSNEDSVGFAISAGASLNSTTGHVGSTLTVSGTGFNTGGTITIKYDTTEVATTTADTEGAFTITFDVPASQYGEHTVTATDGTNIQQLAFTMESTAPPVPSLLLPEASTKAGSETYFDWEDVTDVSSVTYSLQIATGADFTADSTLVEKEGLDFSEYTLTEEEELESVGEEEPYYWRVKAVDGASNESEWSTPRPFHVGFQWPELPGWLKFVLIVIGAILIGLFGFWLGRRTAYFTY